MVTRLLKSQANLHPVWEVKRTLPQYPRTLKLLQKSLARPESRSPSGVDTVPAFLLFSAAFLQLLNTL